MAGDSLGLHDSSAILKLDIVVFQPLHRIRVLSLNYKKC